MEKSTEDSKLNSTWEFWYASRKKEDHSIPYANRLLPVIEISTINDFIKSYSYIKPVELMERNTDISLFKKGYQPLWESCPKGAYWFLRFKRTDSLSIINLKWERLILALICESFEEPNILGAVLSIRGRETILELWFNYFKSEKIKNNLAHKLRQFLQIDSNYNIFFKDNESSIEDKSTIRNAEIYAFKKKRKSTYN